MPRYTITQTYSAPRELTDDERQELARAVEAAALTYLRRTTLPWWHRLLNWKRLHRG